MPDRMQQLLSRFAADFDARLRRYLTAEADVPADLRDAVLYSVLGPGKRLRPFLVGRCCTLVGGAADTAWVAAAAIECVHAFSLVHDDLPAMDDDDLRRGRPTTHKKFDEAVAILAGDALAVLAFELLARHYDATPIGASLVAELASAAGWAGMIGGQAADLAGESLPPTLDRVQWIHIRKTARLFAAACRMGALCGSGTVQQADELGRYGTHLGLAFQIADDLLDVTSTTARAGKAVGKDEAKGKQSYPRCVGVAESRAAADRSVRTAIEALAGFGTEAEDLRALAQFARDRNY